MAFTASYAVLWLFVAFQMVVILALIQRVVGLHRALSDGHESPGRELPTGTMAPDFSAIDLRSGQRVRADGFASHSPALLFVSPSCSACKDLIVSLAEEWPATLGQVVLLCSGAREDCGRLLSALAPSVPTLWDEDRRILAAFKAQGLPTTVVLDARNQIVAYGHPRTAELFRAFVERVRERGAAPARGREALATTLEAMMRK